MATTAAAAPQIPGFYYDEDKKKYFRIQRNHVLPSSSTVHTQQSVKAKQEQSRHEAQRQQHQRRLHISHIRKSPLTDRFGFKLLQRRIGVKKGCSISGLIAREFAETLTSRPACGTSLHQESIGEVISGSFHITREGLLTAAVGSSSSKTLLTAWPSSAYGSDEGGYAYATSLSSWGNEEHRKPVEMLRGEGNVMVGFNTPYDHMSCYEGEGFEIKMENSSISTTTTTMGDTQLISKTLTLPEDAPVWDIASCPTTSDIAIGSGYGLYLARCPTTPAEVATIVPGSPRDPWQMYLCPNTIQIRLNERPGKKAWRGAQMNVTFKDANVIMSSERSGIVNFSDRRTHTGIARLQHPSAVLDTTPTKNTNQVVVHGFSTTSIYDLRYTKAPTLSGRQRPKGSRSGGSGGSSTRTTEKSNSSSIPMLDFAVPEDRHADRYMKGKQVAYSPDLDLIAATTTKAHISSQVQSFVTLYSTTTGRVLHGPLTDTTFSTPVKCIDIKRLRDGPESIVILSDEKLLEWTIHGDFDNSRWRKMTRVQRDDWFDCKRDVSKMMSSRPEVYSVARRWEQGNLGPI